MYGPDVERRGPNEPPYWDCLGMADDNEEPPANVEEEADEDEEGAESPADDNVPAERSGHVAVTDGTRMLVWGGYKNAPVRGFYDFYLPRDEIWIHDMENGSWQRLKTKGNVPPSMSGSCAACVDNVLYLFGGHHARGNGNMLFKLDLCSKDGDLFWEKVECKGTAPSPRDKLGVWVYQNKLIYFGGYGYYREDSVGTFEFDESSFGNGGHNPRGWNNHVHVLNLDNFTWTRIVPTGKSPSPRAAHACATAGNRGYVFGGRYRDSRMNDMYYLDFNTWEWHEVNGQGVIPVGRSWHSLTQASLHTLFLFGGFTTDKQPLSDSWIFNIRTNEWLPFQGCHQDKPRLWHTACASKEGEIFVFGGCANNLLAHHKAAHSNEVLVFSVQPRSLVRLCLETVIYYREILASSLDCLPKHLLHSVHKRFTRVNNTCGS